MKKLLLILFCGIGFLGYAQTPYPSAPPASGNITDIEYFIDTKQDIGSGTALTGFTPSTNLSAYNGTVSLASLPSGFHRIYFRSKDADGKWSFTHSAAFDNYNVPLYATAPPPSSNITDIEYFIDTKQDIGSGTALTGFTASTNLSAYNGTVSLGSLPSGFHRIYFRSKDADGKWSLTNSAAFDNYNVPLYNVTPTAPSNIVQVEYFIDNNDLGFGNCTQIPITPNTNIAGLSANINVTGLPQGVHRLYIRSKDAIGKWSLTNLSVFDNSAVLNYPAAPATAPAIGNMEYFIDTDPGFGNGTAITTPSNTGTIDNYSVNLNLSGTLSVGTHYLYIRSKQNPWSVTNVIPFSTTIPLPVSWLYVKAELINATAKVSWGTASEINTDKFEVEHSIDGNQFAKVGEVAAAGNSSNYYYFNHSRLVQGINYYRIKQLDKDGSFKYSAIVTILNRNGLTQTIIAPNPVKDVLHIIEPQEVLVQTVEIYSSTGALIMRKNMNSNAQVYSLPVSQLANGGYVLKINYADSFKSYPFIKQ